MSRITYIEYETELEEFFGERFFATVWMKVECEPGEPMVMYTRNGDGYPGSPPSVWPVEAKVTSLSGATWDKNREQLEASGWAEILDERALQECEEACDGGWLADHLFDELAAMEEDTRW